jgi:spore coat protein U-like protein
MAVKRADHETSKGTQHEDDDRARHPGRVGVGRGAGGCHHHHVNFRGDDADHGAVLDQQHGDLGSRVVRRDQRQYTIGLDQGTTTGASISQRLLVNGAATINYNLFTSAAYSTIWGNSGGALVNSTGNGADQTFTIYGRVPAQTTPAPGTYTDTVTVTVTY